MSAGAGNRAGAGPVVQPSSSRRASSLSKGPTLAQKQESSTHIPAEGIQDPLPVLTAVASKTLGSVWDSTHQLDASTLGPTPGPTLHYSSLPPS